MSTPTLGNTLPLLQGGGASFSSAANALFAAMTVQPNAARKALINSTIVAWQASGVWDLADLIVVLAAHDEQAALLNWKNPATFIPVVVNSPVFTIDRGELTDGATSYVDLSWARTQGINFQQNAATFAFGTRTSAQSAVGVAGTATGTGLLITPRTTLDQLSYRVNQATATAATTISDGSGFTAATRTGATATQGYKDGTVFGAAGAVASGALTSVNINLGRANGNFAAVEFTDVILAGALNATQHAAYASARLAYMQGVGAA